VKHHYILKLRNILEEKPAIPYWVDFINDKSIQRDSLIPEFDQLMRKFAMQFWVTKEYKLEKHQPTLEEIEHGLERTYRIILQKDYEIPDDLVQRIRLIPLVEDVRSLDVAQVDVPISKSFTRSPTQVRPQDLIRLNVARQFTRGQPQIRIAVLDTGVNQSHPELQGTIASRADFVNLVGMDTSAFIGDFTGYDSDPEDTVGHGTHVCGIIAAKGLHMDEGIAPDCKLMPVRVLATMKQGNRGVGAGIVDNINTGIKWAVDNGANVINMSLGIKHSGGGLPHQDVIKYALSKNVTVVAASGNDGSPERYYPGALDGVIAVGAVDSEGKVAGFTSYGANIFVVAPGTNIYSSFAHGGYAHASGTSQASPFVASAVGLLKSYALERGITLTNTDVTYILKSTSDRVDTRLRNLKAGYGLVNLADAFRLITHLLN